MNEINQWRPNAPIENLIKRAKILTEIRRFFSDRGILEVETPSMSQAAVTDIHLSSFETSFFTPGHTRSQNLYFITSPEYHMKRLLAAGSGAIYQICRSFRNEEEGRWHNPEFTLLEWYRPHYDMYRLMNEVDDLVQQITGTEAAESLSYQQAFIRYLQLDPLTADIKQLQHVARQLQAENIANTEEDRDTLLQLLFMLGVEPHIGQEKPVFIYHYPASQASLAKISAEDHRLAERFELYFRGMELANGFHELIDSEEQRRRFDKDNYLREKRGLPKQPVDHYLLEALTHGISPCSGVALGLDRLVMIALNAHSISDVVAFTVGRC